MPCARRGRFEPARHRPSHFRRTRHARQHFAHPWIPMRAIALTVAVLLLTSATPAVRTMAQPADPPPTSGGLQVVWEVTNRFRLFRDEKDFRRHVAADLGNGVLAAERKLA